MKCPSCNGEVAEGAAFCSHCGADTREASQEPVNDAPVVAEDTSSPPHDEESHEGTVRPPVERLKEFAKANTEDDESITFGWTEGGYSGKAMRGHFLLALLFTIPFVAFGIYFVVEGTMQATSPMWLLLLALPAALWIYLWCIYIYRVWTIRYRLTAYRFFHEEGIFNRVCDVIEVIDMDDIQHEQSLWDRYINGNVGTVIVDSSDPSHPQLKLRGLEDSEAAFEAIDNARRQQRSERGLKSI